MQNNMIHFIFQAVNSNDTLLVPLSARSALIKVVSHRPGLFAVGKNLTNRELLRFTKTHRLMKEMNRE